MSSALTTARGPTTPAEARDTARLARRHGRTDIRSLDRATERASSDKRQEACVKRTKLQLTSRLLVSSWSRNPRAIHFTFSTIKSRGTTLKQRTLSVTQATREAVNGLLEILAQLLETVFGTDPLTRQIFVRTAP